MVLQESKKYLIDTNILIYAVNENSAYHEKALDLLQNIAVKSYNACISTQNILEFQRVLTHKSFENVLPQENIDEIVKIWLDYFEVIFEDKTVWLEYQKLTKRIKPSGNKIFDLWLSATMKANGVDVIITVNTKDFKNIKGIKAINPFL